MDPILKKLNIKDQSAGIILNAPDTVSDILKAWSAELKIYHSLLDKSKRAEFVLAFIQSQAQINELVPAIDSKLLTDGLFWIAYPKQSSKRYTCDFNRDKGWEILGKLGYEGVRQIAIDEDWSALRFRKTAFIKSLTRNEKMMLSKEGKDRRKDEK